MLEATSPSAAALASNQLAFDVYDQLRRDEGNFVFSPISVSSALMMALAGARNETAAQIAHVLHVSPAPGAHDRFAALIGSLNEGRAHTPSTLRIADRVWVQSGMEVLADFRARMRDSYRAPLGEVDFGDPVGAAETVDAWAKQETGGRISHVLAPDRLTTSTRFVLASAVFFKGIWHTQFDERATRDEPFSGSRGAARVPLMWTRGALGYARRDGAQVVELDYASGCSFVVVVPDARDGLRTVEENIVREREQWLKVDSSRKVDLRLPRWTTTAGVELDRILQAMGMGGAFRAGADFSGMVAARGLFLGEVFQQAFIDVNEQGTEAAAVSAVTGYELSDEPGPEPVVVRADHPFFYAVRDRSTGALLFLGRFEQPG